MFLQVVLDDLYTNIVFPFAVKEITEPHTRLAESVNALRRCLLPNVDFSKNIFWALMVNMNL
jgi:hypothetical protein